MVVKMPSHSSTVERTEYTNTRNWITLHKHIAATAVEFEIPILFCR